ncbi:MAG: S-layer homology domain-containing protein [Myxococcota bacterium]
MPTFVRIALVCLFSCSAPAVDLDAGVFPDAAAPDAGAPDVPAAPGVDEPEPDWDAEEEPSLDPLEFKRGARFSDVGQSWALYMISELGSDGVVAGYANGTFRPNAPVTRAELAALLVAAFPGCRQSRGARSFPDVARSFWGHDAIRKAYRCGMMSGYPDGSFGPGRTTTRLESVVAIHGAMRGDDRRVDDRARTLEGWSTSRLEGEIRRRYFDVGPIGSWAYAALLSASEAGMVVLGEDRMGVERGTRRVLNPSGNATRADVAALLYGSLYAANNGNSVGNGPTPTALSGFRAAPRSGGALLDGEWVLTFDDGPRANSARVARTLRQKNVTAVFFMVSQHIGTTDGSGVQLSGTHASSIAEVLRQGHVVANHMHRHCIHGLSCRGRGVAELTRAEFDSELTRAHRILRAMVADAGYAPREKLLHFFRAPGGATSTSWSATTTAWANLARIPANYRGNVAWDVPSPGHDHSLCWGAGRSGPECARRYLDNIARNGLRKGVILIHDNMEQSASMVGPLIDGIRARGGRFVHPRCVVGCSR